MSLRSERSDEVLKLLRLASLLAGPSFDPMKEKAENSVVSISPHNLEEDQVMFERHSVLNLHLG